MKEVAVICPSMEYAKWLMNCAVKKAPTAYKKRGRNYLLTTNNVKYIFMSSQTCEMQLRGFRGLQIGDKEFEKIFTCGFAEVKGDDYE